MKTPIRAWRKPTAVQCLQFDGMNLAYIEEFVGSENFKVIGRRPLIKVAKWNGPDPWQPLMVGDWVMTEPDGKGFYPCAANIFADLYSTKEPAWTEASS